MLPRYSCVDTLFLAFRNIMTAPTYNRTRTLLIGAILANGVRTVASVLRASGLSQDSHFANYHHVLSRARWSCLRAARILLGLLIDSFASNGPLVLGGDETLERRRGLRISKLGVYHDAVRSSKSFFVKSNGLRWVCLMLLARVPFADRIWALPFLSALSPSERYDKEQNRRHKTTVDWMRQMLCLVRRWLPDRTLVFVADSGYAALDLLDRCRKLHITAITRFRLDAALFAPVTIRQPGTNGRPRKKGLRLPTLQERIDDPATAWSRLCLKHWYSQAEREVDIATGQAVWTNGGRPQVPIRWLLIRDPLGKFKTQALLCTDPNVEPIQMLAWFVERWRLEVTFQEVRTHLGVETQRQWSDNAIDRTTPLLLGLFSFVTLTAHRLDQRSPIAIRQAAWYCKNTATFADAIEAVRRHLRHRKAFVIFEQTDDITKHNLTFQPQVRQHTARAA
jgi:hypothetical protein